MNCLRMSFGLGTRDELVVDLTAACGRGEPLRLLVVFRLGGLEASAGWRDGVVDSLVGYAAGRLSDAGEPAGCFYRPRKDELCGLFAGRLERAEGAVSSAVSVVNDRFGSDGLAVGYGTAVLPHEASVPLDALRLAEGRIAGGSMPRGSTVGAAQPFAGTASSLTERADQARPLLV